MHYPSWPDTWPETVARANRVERERSKKQSPPRAGGARSTGQASFANVVEGFRIAMKANQINGAAPIASFPSRQTSFLSADWRLHDLRSAAESVLSSYKRISMMSLLFSIGIWLSSLAALWMSRGWIGLLMSGQLLSTAAGLCRGLPKIPQAGFRGIESAKPFEGGPDGL